MTSNKREFLIAFNRFLDGSANDNSGKCYFETIDNHPYQGWIVEIKATTFTYLDSGPLAQDDPIVLEIEMIDVDTFAYWDSGAAKWLPFQSM